MSVNASRLPSALSSSFNFYHEAYNCFNTTVGTFSITTFTVTSVLLLLPLYILVLYLGLQRRRQQRCGATTSHSDLFTYHMVFMELISVLGSCLCCCGVHTDHPLVTLVGIYLSVINLTGQMLFHILTCVERYLAVVHPVTYRSLKEARGIRMRNVIIGCVWLLCFAGTGLMSFVDEIHVSNMSNNSSSSSIVEFSYLFSDCFDSRAANFIFTAFSATNILLLLPLFIIILHLAHQRRRQQRSASASDSDFIAYHMVVMEIIYSIASIFYCIGAYTDLKSMMTVATYVFLITFCGQISFHTLTCVGHYLAVVHPITFMRLRKGSGVRIRNITAGSIWLLCFTKMSLLALNPVNYIILVYFVHQAVSLIIVSFCSLAVLRVLKRPGPGRKEE
ncbi:hypothetical protein GBF38_005130 [Nibea albiflora]|uniref:Uncharacterized protein n=1 Tax=Nibea albiflora TaxID=240163 RepID=A0ACB7EZ06_NIBAL|nr:hypothetical protein GBF38_005130 [Nibea albiflora]